MKYKNLYEFLKDQQLPYTLHHVILGPVEVTLQFSTTNCPIYVCTTGVSYTREGKIFNRDKYPTLYLKPNTLNTGMPEMSKFKDNDEVVTSRGVIGVVYKGSIMTHDLLIPASSWDESNVTPLKDYIYEIKKKIWG